MAHVTRSRQIELPAMRLVRSSRAARRLGVWLSAAIVVAAVAMVFVPWRQTSRGTGTVSAFAPFDRQAVVESRIAGRVVDVADGIVEGARVEKGQFLLRIENNDPNYLENLEAQKARLEEKVAAAEEKARLYRGQRLILETYRDQTFASADALVDEMNEKMEAMQRDLDQAIALESQAEQTWKSQKALADRGIKSGLEALDYETKLTAARLKREQSENYLAAAEKSLESKELDRDRYRQDAEAKLTQIDTYVQQSISEAADYRKQLADLATKIAQFARSNEVFAPSDGVIQQVSFNMEFDYVKEDQPLMTLIPDTDDLAVELLVPGNDVPLVTVGRPVRLQFEGIPAIVVSGWPEAAVNVFDGRVAAVDPAQDATGKLRVLVRPESRDDWPEERFLRRGGRVNGWVILDTVPLGYEIWRQLNGFPANLPPAPGEKSTDAKKEKPILPK